MATLTETSPNPNPKPYLVDVVVYQLRGALHHARDRLEIQGRSREIYGRCREVKGRCREIKGRYREIARGASPCARSPGDTGEI